MKSKLNRDSPLIVLRRHIPKTEIQEYESSLTIRQQALLHRSNLFACIQNVIQGTKFREACILLRLMAQSRGIEGSALGYLSPSIIELIASRYYHDLSDESFDAVGSRSLRLRAYV
jgi:hypothetical protein